jgi:hypothetical protein
MPIGKNNAPAIKKPHKPAAKHVKICVNHAKKHVKPAIHHPISTPFRKI